MLILISEILRKNKINKKKILNKNFKFYSNYIFFKNCFFNYNKIIIINKIKKNFLFIKIPIIDYNCKIDKILSSIKTTIFNNIYCILEKSIEIFIIKIQSIKFKYEEVTIPLLINYPNLLYSGQIPKFYNNLFKIENLNSFLIPTSEVILNSLSFFIKNFSFSIKLICNSYCFRKEIGKFGKENIGLKRQQQFKKIEIFQFFKKNESLERFYSISCNILYILKLLKLKNRIIKIHNTDLNENSFLSFDFEIWDYSTNTWIEISSLSLCLNKPFNIIIKNKKINIINASCLPLGRLIYLIFLFYRINNNYIKIPKKLNKILTELLKW